MSITAPFEDPHLNTGLLAGELALAASLAGFIVLAASIRESGDTIKLGRMVAAGGAFTSLSAFTGWTLSHLF